MFETRNNPRCMVPIQQSLENLGIRPLVELREEIKEPMLRSQGEAEGRQSTRGIAHSPYESGPHHKHGEVGGAGSGIQ